MPKNFFVDVILPLSLPRLLTYSVPGELETEIAVGKRVVVQLGKPIRNPSGGGWGGAEESEPSTRVREPGQGRQQACL